MLSINLTFALLYNNCHCDGNGIGRLGGATFETILQKIVNLKSADQAKLLCFIFSQQFGPFGESYSSAMPTTSKDIKGSPGNK